MPLSFYAINLKLCLHLDSSKVVDHPQVSQFHVLNVKSPDCCKCGEKKHHVECFFFLSAHPSIIEDILCASNDANQTVM